MALPKIPLYAKVLAGVTGAVVGSASLVYVARPSVFLNVGQSWKRHQAGFRRKTIVLDGGFLLSYAEKGQPIKGLPTMVMMHGFTGGLDAAVPVVQTLPQDAHVISIDAPAHGRSSAVIEDDFRMMGMARRLKQFATKTGLDKRKFHLVGWAMGGTIAGCYAGEYSEDLELLTIACPGMKCPKERDSIKEVISGKEKILLPRNPQELQDLMDLLLEKKIKLPPKILDFIFYSRMKRRGDHRKVLKYMIDDALRGNDNLYIKQIAKIRAPTQIIWGEKDGLLDVSGADLLQETLGTNCKRKDVVLNCGHTFFMEEPHTLGGLVTAFQMDQKLQKASRLDETDVSIPKDNKPVNASKTSTNQTSISEISINQASISEISTKPTSTSEIPSQVISSGTSFKPDPTGVGHTPERIQSQNQRFPTLPPGQCLVCQMVPIVQGESQKDSGPVGLALDKRESDYKAHIAIGVKQDSTDVPLCDDCDVKQIPGTGA